MDLTCGVSPPHPPRRPYRPRLSGSNKVGYTRDRRLAAHGGSGLGGMGNGPGMEHSLRHVLLFVFCEGLRVGHTVHGDWRETRRPCKAFSGAPRCTGPRYGGRPAYLSTAHVRLYKAGTN